MRKYVTATLGLALLLVLQCFAQELPLSIRIERVKANRSECPQLDKGRSLKDEVSATHHDVERRSIVIDDLAKGLNYPLEPPEDNSRIRSATHSSDLVAVGTVTNDLSTLTANEAFIFTDSEFKISEIWKGNVSPGVLDDGGTMDEITVTAPGGIAKIQGNTVRAIVSNRAPLQMGHTYLLFLTYLPNSHSYKTVGGLIGFDLTGGAITCLYKGVPPPNANLISNRSEYLAAIHSSVERQQTKDQSR